MSAGVLLARPVHHSALPPVYQMKEYTWISGSQLGERVTSHRVLLHLAHRGHSVQGNGPEAVLGGAA
jgi:hypothetical protein